HVIALRARTGRPVLGICGGCQMLGRSILDPHGVESSQRESQGLGHLPLVTEFRPEKRTQQVWATPTGQGLLFAQLDRALRVPGYFIHAGITAADGACLFEVEEQGVSKRDGGVDESGGVAGSMVHGLFEHDGLRHAVIDRLLSLRGAAARSAVASWDRQRDYDKLADALRAHCDTAWLDRLVGV
ncbi:MAG TPA: cobyric acid synthase CobQ, partial [Polyangiales bacterium]